MPNPSSGGFERVGSPVISGLATETQGYFVWINFNTEGLEPKNQRDLEGRRTSSIIYSSLNSTA
jgi:hypothetical protein